MNAQEIRDEIVDEYLEEQIGDEPKDYTPTTDEDFEYRVRRRAEALERREKLVEWRDRELHAIKARFDARIAELDREVEHNETLIHAGVERLEPGKDGKRKLKLPSATIYEQTRGSLDVAPDADALISWALESDRAALVKRSIDKAALKKLVSGDGFTVVESGEIIDTSTGVVVPDVLYSETTSIVIRSL